MTVFNCFGRCTRDGRAPFFLYLQIQQLRAKLTNEQRGNKEKRAKRTGNRRGQLAGIRNHRGRMAGKGVLL